MVNFIVRGLKADRFSTYPPCTPPDGGVDKDETELSYQRCPDTASTGNK